MRPSHRRVPTALAILPLAVTVLSVSRTPASAATYRVLSRRTVAPGVVFTKLVESSPQNHIFVLRVNLSKKPSLDTALASRALGGFERTSSMAARLGAVAAVNGDFSEWWGRPAHAFARDGAFEFTALRGGPQFALSRDERTGFVGLATPRIEAWLPKTATPISVTRWNAGSPATDSLAAYSPAGVPNSPDGTCGVKLRASGPPSWRRGRRP